MKTDPSPVLYMCKKGLLPPNRKAMTSQKHDQSVTMMVPGATIIMMLDDFRFCPGHYHVRDEGGMDACALAVDVTVTL